MGDKREERLIEMSGLQEREMVRKDISNDKKPRMLASCLCGSIGCPISPDVRSVYFGTLVAIHTDGDSESFEDLCRIRIVKPLDELGVALA